VSDVLVVSDVPVVCGAAAVYVAPVPELPNIASSSSYTAPDPMGVAEKSWVGHYRIHPGDALVIESHEQLLKIHNHSDHFAGMREVVDSKPPITNSFADRCVRADRCLL
jgi:hypothetical protein